jgi:hypothetical protein
MIENHNNTSLEGPRLALLFVSGLPGIGKSTLFKYIIDHWTNSGFNVVKVESDVVRQEAMKIERLRPENSLLSPLELEIKSKPLMTEMLNQEIRNEISGLRDEVEGDSIFILDKNYVPESLIEVIREAARDSFGSNVSSFLILPDQSLNPELEINLNGKVCPFYLDTLCASLVKVFSRKGHISLCHGYSHSLKSVVGVVISYSGQVFEDIAEKYDMKILHFDYFNAEKLKQEPLFSVLK